mmetsp:Transcript_28201/g.83498  ORF Transcript_28201/g.83498 Transcript_28201/m.83498 type:complete len:419 (-) Transcript_28201:573-1829(-)
MNICIQYSRLPYRSNPYLFLFLFHAVLLLQLTGLSPRHSPIGSRIGQHGTTHGGATPFANHAEVEPQVSPSGSAAGEPGLLSRVQLGSMRQAASTAVACLPLLTSLSNRLHGDAAQPAAVAHVLSQGILDVLPSPLPPAGFSLKARDISLSAVDVEMMHEEGEASHFRLRTLDYMASKEKASGSAAIYRLATVDMFSFDSKVHHVAQLVNLPKQQWQHLHVDPAIYPPLLIVNLQMPAYKPSIFGGSNDGPGWSCVFYFALPDGFDPLHHPNQKALALLQRFVADSKEADGSRTRDRFKIIPRIVNVEEWGKKAPLSTAEYRLLRNYNEKPVLSRPQHTFFSGPGYLEVDVDVHTYAYAARVALQSFVQRLGTAVWDIAFVIQGNGPDELPEQVLCTARMHRVPFTPLRPYTELLPKS